MSQRVHFRTGVRKSQIPNRKYHMKPIMRYQSQLLFRKSYKPNRVIRIRPTGKRNLLLRPSRARPETQIRSTPNTASAD
jgi:hypothetical protein